MQIAWLDRAVERGQQLGMERRLSPTRSAKRSISSRFYSISQIEYCRNFIFKRHFPIHKIFERNRFKLILLAHTAVIGVLLFVTTR